MKKRKLTKGKYKTGEIVYSKDDLTRKLIVRRYVTRMYFCRLADAPEGKDFAFFERELINDAEIEQIEE